MGQDLATRGRALLLGREREPAELGRLLAEAAENELGHVYRKLGIASCRRLRDALATQSR